MNQTWFYLSLSGKDSPWKKKQQRNVLSVKENFQGTAVYKEGHSDNLLEQEMTPHS